ncbi:chemotaxis protein CheA [Thermodesulfitimonas sp.]
MFSDAEISVFLDELEEKIQILNDNFLLLEKEADDQQILQEIFRAAHTVKGSSAIMGYDRMSRLTHEMENLFDNLRQGRLSVSTEMIDVLFEALDTLRSLRDEITEQAEPVDIEPVVAKLRRFLPDEANKSTAGEIPAVAALSSSGSAFNLTEAEEEVVRAAYVRGMQAYWIKVVVDAECQMKSARAYLVFQTLQEQGEIIKAVPPAEDLQEGKFDTTFELVLLTQEDADRIRHLLLTISEIVDVSVETISLPEDETVEAMATGVAESTQTATPAGKHRAGGKPREREETVKQAKTVRVDVQKLDNLMNLVGELVIDRTRLNRFAEIFRSRYGSDDLVDVLNEISNHLGQLTNDLQEQIMKARMLPIAQVFNRFPRMVRDLAHKLGKEINFIVEGKDTELDRNVIEVIGDPLIHLLRNAVDHGIESPEERVRVGKPRTGTVLLKAFHQENHIVILVRDDGRGMDVEYIRKKAVERGLVDTEMAGRLTEREVLNFVFLPGFSTAQEVTDLSGRGVGLDVVKKNIEQINGYIEMNSVLGQGTEFEIKLPLTLAIIRALMVSVSGEVYAFPLANVMETIRISPQEVKKVQKTEVIIVRGKVLPLISLAEYFGGQRINDSRLYVVIIGVGNRRVGVVVEALLGEQEIVIKSLGEYLGRIPGISGATILGDGRVALIVDARALTQEVTRGLAEEALYAAS